jgi:2-polyprenyl-3-methyl-5-hydroxy-6-metoxy-1,4-benzoquinol methylase
MQERQSLSESDLVRFCSEIFSKEPMHQRFVNEARFGLSRVLRTLSSFDPETVEVLEVGAGSCILSSYLASKRLHVTAVEPLGPEFDFFTDLQNRVLEFCRRNSIELKLVRSTAEQLNLPGRFDVAFTINALEHMRDPLLTIDNMYKSLKPGGVVLVHCPNYTIPFEVHFNIFLVTRSKPINEWLYRSKISRYPKVWDELNFVRYVDVRRHLVDRGANFAFEGSVMHDLMARLLNDPIFAERMPAIVRAVGAMLRYTGLLHALTCVPTRFQTPMEVHIKKS